MVRCSLNDVSIPQGLPIIYLTPHYSSLVNEDCRNQLNDKIYPDKNDKNLCEIGI